MNVCTENLEPKFCQNPLVNSIKIISKVINMYTYFTIIL